MSVWQIEPKTSVGPLSLDSSVEQVELVLGNSCDRFKRGDNPNEILAYDNQGLHVETAGDGRTLAVTVFAPCRIALKGVELLSREVSSVEQELRDAGLMFERVDAGLWNADLLVMLVEHEGRVDGVEVRRVPY